MGMGEEERRLRREMRRMERRRQEKIRRNLFLALLGVSVLIILAAVAVLIKMTVGKGTVDPGNVEIPEYVKAAYLTPNPYSRPQKPLEKVNGIVVHYTANPGALVHLWSW